MTLQAAIWFAGFSPEMRQIMGLAVGDWHTFDGEPMAMPDSDSMPLAVPRFSASSRDRQWEVRVSKGRLDVFRRQQETNELVDAAQFIRVALETLHPFLALSNDLTVQRIAFVVHRAAVEEDPASTLANYFCRTDILQGPLNRPSKFEIHALKVYQPEGLPEINSWIRWEVGARRETGDPVILLKQDLNTLAEAKDTARFGMEDLESFFERIPKEADEILSLYLGV